MDWLLAILGSSAFLSGFGVFTGVVAGALIQHLLNVMQSRRQARNALEVLQIEIAYNRSEVDNLRKHIQWLKSRIASNQIIEEDLFIPMHKFDYSSITPLVNSGYFHVMLGAERVRAYLEFTNFFRTDNGRHLSSKLKAEHEVGKSMAFLEWVEGSATDAMSGLEPIQNAKLPKIGYRLKVPREN